MGILVDRLGTKTINAAGITIWSAATMLTGGRVVREWIPAGERGVTNAIFMAGTQAGPSASPVFCWRRAPPSC